MAFLKAAWRNLAIANYEVDSALLRDFLPAGTELDLWNERCYVSLVGFMFTDVRVLGIPVPFHTEFEEVNLRFYVKRFDGVNWKRGVVFIRELVPKRAITFVANSLYKEHYKTVHMRHLWAEEQDHRIVQYEWKSSGDWNLFQVRAALETSEMELGSEAEFITEHYWGYTRIDDKTTAEYEVKHPRWKIYPIHESTIQVDFAKTYGPEFEFLNNQNPVSVMLAEGSDIRVENKKTLH